MQVSYRDMLRSFGRIGLLSFGGPAAQIALMQDELVGKKRWLDTDTFLRALSFCMLLPGPEAMQLATYAGWRLRGIWGGFLAGALFVLPGACVIAVLAALYLNYGQLPAVRAAFMGIQATVIVVVIQALLKLSRRALRGPADIAVAVCAFAGIFVIGLPFPVILGCAALVGLLRGGHGPNAPARPPASPPNFALLAVLALAWLIPIFGLWLAGGGILADIAGFFAWLAVVTFGGAYAVLAYMTQAVVTDFGWLTTQQMIDALGLAETTPGPLILVTQFVGTLAGAAQGGLMFGLLAGALTLWVTFVPCFLWIFAGAPYLERLTANARLASALASITAAVVGVIANLSVWFALHALFAQLTPAYVLWAEVPVPVLSSLQPQVAALCVLAALGLIWRGWPLPWVLLSTALCAALPNLLALAQ